MTTNEQNNALQEIEISVVIPLLNETGNINNLYVELQPVLKKISPDYEILYVDDGSSDDSFQKVIKLHEVDPRVRGISLSRNFGQQAALYAGIENARGRTVVTMDADLQHPVYVIPRMYEEYLKGADIVNTIRKYPPSTGYLKKATSRMFYSFINLMSDVRIEPSSVDFRLMNRKSVDAFLQMKEKDRFTRGMVSWIGFRQIFISYDADLRVYSKSRYTMKKLIKLASVGITSFSSRPLTFSLYVGAALFCFSIIYFIYTIIRHFTGSTVPGWTSLMVAILMLGSFQLILSGIIGTYIARIYNETKNRPVYFKKDEI